MIQIGLRAHDFGKMPPDQLADIIAAHHLATIQLNLGKAIIPAPEPGTLSSVYAGRIRKIFNDRNISIAVLSCYINPVHPDREQREKQLKIFEEHLRYARDFGCTLVGTETGSLNPDCLFHPETEKEETFELLCSSIERPVNYAEKYGSVVAVEAMAHYHTVSTVEKMEKLLLRFPSPSLKVIWDLVNLIPITGLEESQEHFFTRVLDMVGDKIAVIHAKDFRMQGGVKKGDLSTGTGELDWMALLKLLQQRKDGIDIILENTDQVGARRTIAFLRETAEKALRN